MAKNPTTKRIMKEAAELTSSPSADYHAAPLENDMYEWHFTLRGPPEHSNGSPSPYAGGVYHGRIILPPAYPLKPPSFRFLTPTGRFEVNREICLSISGHHEETWQPAWGIRTALVAIRSFMDTDAKGQLGGMEASDEVRKRFAGQSQSWRCSGCGRANHEIMKEQDEAVKDAGAEQTQQETVPEELRLAYKEDLGREQQAPAAATIEDSNSIPSTEQSAQQTSAPPTAGQAAQARLAPPPVRRRMLRTETPETQAPGSTTTERLRQQRQDTRARGQRDDGVPAWIDKAIYGVLIVLVVLLLRKMS